MASPPTRRPIEKINTEFARAAPTVDTAKRIAATRSDLRRPIRSPIRLAPAAPNRQPRRRALAATSVSMLDRENWRRRKGSRRWRQRLQGKEHRVETWPLLLLAMDRRLRQLA